MVITRQADCQKLRNRKTIILLTLLQKVCNNSLNSKGLNLMGITKIVRLWKNRTKKPGRTLQTQIMCDNNLVKSFRRSQKVSLNKEINDLSTKIFPFVVTSPKDDEKFALCLLIIIFKVPSQLLKQHHDQLLF